MTNIKWFFPSYQSDNLLDFNQFNDALAHPHREPLNGTSHKPTQQGMQTTLFIIIYANIVQRKQATHNNKQRTILLNYPSFSNNTWK